jgi:uncharacterized membrane protein YbhN (UPF0104 family)
VLVGALAFAAAAIAIDDQRKTLGAALAHIGVWPMVASFFCGVAGVVATFGTWDQVLKGLGVDLPRQFGARVFFISQLGKYLPGSVWPVLMQMEAGRSRGAKRRTMLAGSLITILMNCAVGLIMACILLPIYDSQALSRYWWALLALPFLLALLHPKAIPGLLDRVFAVIHRPPLGDRLSTTHVLRATGWSVVSWIGLGAQVGVLCLAVGRPSLSHFVLSVGGMALAYSLGVLFVPAPAGAGVREVVLILVLGSVLSPGQALAVALVSRALLIGVDIVLAGLAVAVPLARRYAGAILR